MEGQTNGGAGFGIASMVLGIIALVMGCCFPYVSIPCAAIGLILAAVSLGGHKDGKGMAIAGLVCSIIALIPAIIVIVSGASLLSALEMM